MLAMVVNDDAGCLDACGVWAIHREQARSHSFGLGTFAKSGCL